MLGGPVLPVRPLVEKFFSNSCIFQDIMGFQIYTRGPYALWTPLAEKYFYPKRVLHNI